MYPCVISSLMAARIPRGPPGGHHRELCRMREPAPEDPAGQRKSSSRSVEVGPKENYFAFVDGEHPGALLGRHFGIGPEHGYTTLVRLRITTERPGRGGRPAWMPGQARPQPVVF